MGWYGDSVSSLWHSIWDDGYDFGDLTRASLTPITGPLVQGGKDIGKHISDGVNSPEFQDFIDEVGTGLRNTWYKYTGQAHLTDEYKHEEELANTVNQRTALDMMAAGLSKYGMSSSSAGSPSASNGLTLMDAIGKAQQVKAQALSLKEQKYNFDVSKKLGIRTGDKNAFAPVLAIAKSLFGFDLDDIPEEGLIPYVFNHISEWLNKAFDNSDGNGSTAGAVLDAGASAIQDVSKASPLASPNSAVMDLPKVDTKGSAPSVKDVATSDQFEVQNTALRIHHDELYDELGSFAVGQAKGLSTNAFYNKYVKELMKEGFEQSHAQGIVSSWIKEMMADLGYKYDTNDKLWFFNK